MINDWEDEANFYLQAQRPITYIDNDVGLYTADVVKQGYIEGATYALSQVLGDLPASKKELVQSIKKHLHTLSICEHSLHAILMQLEEE